MKTLCVGLCISVFICLGVIIALLLFSVYLFKQYVDAENQCSKNNEIIEELNKTLEEMQTGGRDEVSV